MTSQLQQYNRIVRSPQTDDFQEITYEDHYFYEVYAQTHMEVDRPISRSAPTTANFGFYDPVNL